MFILYKITDQSTGRVYIGLTSKTLEVRMLYHASRARRGSRLPVHAALRHNAFCLVEELCSTDDLAAARQLEQDFIAFFDTRAPNGLNCTKGGELTQGYVRTTETRARHGDMMRALLADPERRLHASFAAREAMNRDDVRERVRAGVNAAYLRPERRANHKAALNRPEVKAKRAEAQRGAMADPETKTRHREAVKAWWAARKAQHVDVSE